MIQFHIQTDSEIPASTQLYNQLQFAIASRQYPPGHRLPSTRQLAQITGLHRNTISKVYRQLEEDGIVSSQAGSGIYVRAQDEDGSAARQRSQVLSQAPDAHRLIKRMLDDLVQQGHSLNQAREIFLAEVDWRLRCSASVLVTVPQQDLGAGQLMVRQLEDSMKIPVQLVPLEELAQVLEQTRSATVVTSRYFLRQAETIAEPKSVRVIPVDIYDYANVLKLVRELPKGSCLGAISLSPGLLRAAEVIFHSLRGDDVLIMTAEVSEEYRLNAIVRSAQTIVADEASFPLVKAAINNAREDLIRPPRLMCCENYINAESISLLRRELGMD